MLPADIMGEDESLALYPLGPSFMPVTAAADWNGTGHSGMVETTRGVAGGTQVFSDEEAEEAPAAYERRWFGSEWSEWAEAGGGGGGIPENVGNLDADSRLATDPLSDFPYGTSFMPTVDWDDDDSFYNTIDAGSVMTVRWSNGFDDPEDPTDEGVQFVFNEHLVYFRGWSAGDVEWGEPYTLQPVTAHEAGAIQNANSPTASNYFVTYDELTALETRVEALETP